MAGFKIEVPKYPKMSMGGIIDAYSKNEADEIFQEKLSEEQLANIEAVPDKADAKNVYTKEQADEIFQEKLTDEQLANIEAVPDKTDRNIASNALKGTASGEAVGITDVSPLEHNMGVKVRSKNLIPYPYHEKTKTQNGLTFTDNGDGSVTVNGTATAETNFMLRHSYNPISLIKGKTYTVSGKPNVEGVRLIVQDIGYRQNIEGTAAVSYDVGYYAFIRIASGTVCDNLIFEPQLEEGLVATPYTPYVPDVSAVSVKKYGKNLLDINDITKTINAKAVIEGNSLLITRTNTASGYSNVYYTLGGLSQYVGKTLTLTCTNESSYMWTCFIGGYSDAWISPSSAIGIQVKGNTQISFTFTAPEIDGASELCFRIQSGDNSIATNETYKLNNIQIELGSTATDYEPYKEPTTYIPNADGAVEGVTSLYPVTTLMTDTAGVIVDAEYNRDINKAYEELVQAIISLGGNV